MVVYDECSQASPVPSGYQLTTGIDSVSRDVCAVGFGGSAGAAVTNGCIKKDPHPICKHTCIYDSGWLRTGAGIESYSRRASFHWPRVLFEAPGHEQLTSAHFNSHCAHSVRPRKPFGASTPVWLACRLHTHFSLGSFLLPLLPPDLWHQRCLSRSPHPEFWVTMAKIGASPCSCTGS